MPSLINGAVSNPSSPSGYITLQQTQFSLGPTPTTSTGYTLVSTTGSQIIFVSSLGNIQFNSGTVYSNVAGQSLTLIGTGTTSVLVTGGTTSTSTTTGALSVQGDMSVWGKVYTGADAYIDGLTVGVGWKGQNNNTNQNNIVLTGNINNSVSGINDGENSIAIGYNTLNGLNTALKVIAIGSNAVSTGTSLVNTIAIGDSALKSIGTVHAIPVNQVLSISTQSGNLYLVFSNVTGYNASILTTGSFVTIIGATGDSTITALNNVGYYAKPVSLTQIQLFRDINLTYPVSGTGTNAASYGSNSAQIEIETVYNDNIAIGTNSAPNLINGQQNFFLGDNVAQNLTTGSYNIFMGHQVGGNMTNGSGNIAIGGYQLVDGVNNQINIGDVFAYNGSGYTALYSNLGVAGYATPATATFFLSNITTITNTNPVLVQTTASYLVSTFTEVILYNVQGMTQVNGIPYYASYVNSTTFGLYYDAGITQPVNGTGFGAYTPGYYATAGSIVFTATNSAWVSVSTSSQFSGALGSTWTIEFWSNAASSSAGKTLPIISQATATTTAIDIGYQNGYLLIGGTQTTITEPASGSWTHVAVVDTAGTVTVYYNGVNQGSTGLTGVNVTNTGTIAIGTRGPSHYGSQYFNGYISNLRITDGIAVYTGAFTTPTTVLADTQASRTNISAIPSNVNVDLLLNTETTSTAYVDSSAYGLTIVNNNSAFSVNGPGLTYGSLLNQGTVYALQPTGALSVLGGVGIAGNLIVSNDVTIYGGLYIQNLITGTITTATNLAGGGIGGLPIQLSTGTTAFIPIGASGYLLQSNGTTATWVAPTSLSASSSTSMLFAPTSSNLYYPTLSLSTSTYSSEYVNRYLSFYVTSTNTSSYFVTGTNALNVPGSVYSMDGNAQAGYKLYTPKVTISTSTPLNPNVGDFWINPTYGVELQYVNDSGNYFWIQFTTGL